MPRTVLMLFALAFFSTAASAKVYKCPSASGGYEYRQVPCDGDGSGEVKIDDPTVSGRAPAEPDEADAGALVGDWCEFAVSTTVDSEKHLDNIHWYFGSDYVTYLPSRAQAPVGVERPQFPLRRAGRSFYVDHSMFGGADASWDVVGRREGVMMVEGPMGGVLHLRPGRC
jgi:hypothetical protein